MSQIIILERFKENHVQTLGNLSLYDSDEGKIFSCVTLELPWENNEQEVSRIPDGHYPAVKHISPKFGDCIWIKHVPYRTEILIHAGNYNFDTKGCILVGRQFVDINADGYLDVSASRDTLQELYELSSNKLTINIFDKIKDGSIII